VAMSTAASARAPFSAGAMVPLRRLDVPWPAEHDRTPVEDSTSPCCAPGSRAPIRACPHLNNNFKPNFQSTDGQLPRIPFGFQCTMRR
jgi:hypothetical protein